MISMKSVVTIYLFIFAIILSDNCFAQQITFENWIKDGFAFNDSGNEKQNFSKIVYPGTDGKLVYVPDSIGNIIPDFSNCGYMGGGVALPKVAVRITLEPQNGNGDDLPRIQEAVDQIAKLPLDEAGFRGAVLLKIGQYRLNGTLKITANGIVLRGEGPGENGTILIATLPKQHNLIEVGNQNPLSVIESTRQQILDEIVPVGARTFQIANAKDFKAGDKIIVHRPSTAEWLAELKMDRLTETYEKKPRLYNWEPGRYDIKLYRTITSIKGNLITIDAPILQGIEKKYGGGSIVKYEDTRIENAGVEELRIISEYDKTKYEIVKESEPIRHGRTTEEPDSIIESRKIRNYVDEDHLWIGILFQGISNGWVRRVTVYHAGYGAVHSSQNSIYTTVQDCAMIDPVSRHTGGRKYSFGANGQMGLFLRCYARNARHDFVLGGQVIGPNVFLYCLGDESTESSESHHRWAVGCLWDNVTIHGDGNLQSVNRGSSGTGHGWSGAQMVFWNCNASSIIVMKPPTAQNYSIGWNGPTDPETLGVGDKYEKWLEWVKWRSTVLFEYKGVPVMGDGYIEFPTEPVSPRSLYLKQLEDRLGSKAVENVIVKTKGVSL